uniref:Uncharacterized protein n=1 Tax=Rhizophora mucronata TaxID=61149 RepID=A0A2P2Q7E2_RHIMU
MSVSLDLLEAEGKIAHGSFLMRSLSFSKLLMLSLLFFIVMLGERGTQRRVV